MRISRQLKIMIALASVGLTFLLLLSRHTVVQPALAQQASQKNWEYCAIVGVYSGVDGWTARVEYYSASGDRTEQISTSSSAGTALAKLGANGWELIGVTVPSDQMPARIYFKRAKAQ